LKLNTIYFYLNEGHNLACRVCWAQSRANLGLSPDSGIQAGEQEDPLPAHGQLSPALFQQALQEGLALGLRSVYLTGGEPLLHPQLDTLLVMLEQHDLKVFIETHGEGLTPELAARIARMARANVAIDIDGADAATHDRLRAKPGSFETATRAVRMFAKAGLKPQIVFSLVKENAAQMTDLIRLAEQLNAWSVRFFLVHPTATVQPPAMNAPSPLEVEELIAIGRRVERELSQSTRLPLFYDQPPAFRGLNPQGPTQVHRRCGVLNAISVMSSGFYALCGFGGLSSDLVFGRVGVHSLEKIWSEHPMLLVLREGIPGRLAGVCERCVMKTTCMGSCVVQNYITTGSFWGPFWFCEAAERASLFPASRLRENAVW
jgi:SynChlorMet cassette radical SAM/SPASM protein ScmF